MMVEIWYRMVNDGDHYHDLIYGWMEFSCSFIVTDFLRHTTAPFPCRRRVRSSAKKPDNSQTSRFLKKETPFSFVRKLRHDANRTVWSSVGCSYIQIQCVCVFIPSQASAYSPLPGLPAPRPLSSITHRSARTCLLNELWQHGEARTESLADSGGSRSFCRLFHLWIYLHTSVGAQF